MKSDLANHGKFPPRPTLDTTASEQGVEQSAPDAPEGTLHRVGGRGVRYAEKRVDAVATDSQ